MWSLNLNYANVVAQGHLKAETDLNKYPTGDWLFFGWMDGLNIIGEGTFDGSGASSWHLNDCAKNKNCKRLPSVSTIHSILS